MPLSAIAKKVGKFVPYHRVTQKKKKEKGAFSSSVLRGKEGTSPTTTTVRIFITAWRP